MKKTAFYIFIFLMGITVSQSVYHYPVLPDPMASHFGTGGQSDNSMPKNAFYVIELVMFLLVVGIFLLMPWAFEKYKVVRMNLPNREYWLKPERIGEVYDYFRVSFCWLGVAHLIFLIGVKQLVYKANMNPPPVLSSQIFLILLGGYFLFVIIWLIMFYRKFKKVE